MKFTRRKRIALELLGPPAIGAVLIITVFAGLAAREVIEKGEALQRFKQVGQVALMAVMGAYLMAGVQSGLYALVMEWRFSRGLDPRSGKTVGLSSVLGFLAGAVIALAMGWRNELLNPALWLLHGGLGLVVGAAMGLLIRLLSR